MKGNKKTYLYVVIFAVILLVVMVVALFLTQKNDGKDTNKAENNGNEQQGQNVPISENKNHENLIKNLNSIEYNGKKLEVKINEKVEEEYKEIIVDGTVVSNTSLKTQLVGIYIYSDWLVLVESLDGNYNIPLYNMKDKSVTEFSNIDGLLIYGVVVEDNGILVKTKNHTIDHYLVTETEDKVNYCNQAELNEKNISDTDRVEVNYQIIITEDTFDVNVIDESAKTVKDIKTYC